MAITDLQAAQEMATKYPDLHRSRQTAFGANYLEDLAQTQAGQPTGTSQYYSGFGLAPDWVTGAIGDPYQAPVVQEPTAGDAQVAEQIAAQDRGAGVTGASAVYPMDQAGAVAAMTQPDAYNIPGTMPQTPVSDAWGPQDYLQRPIDTRNELEKDIDRVATEGAENVGYYGDPSYTGGLPGDVTQIGPGRLDLDTTFDPITSPEQINIDPRIVSEEQGLSGDPKFWEDAKNKFLETGKDVGNTFKNLTLQGVDFAKMAGGAIMNMVLPGLGLLANILPKDSPIDAFNRKYQLGGEFYEDIVEGSGDPNFEKRLQDYAGDFAGNIEGKDPFGKNVVSQFGDYPKMATETYNELIEKQKQKAAEGKELAQYDKDRLDYYGHVSGLTGKTNIPGTPLMVDTSPLKTFPDDEIAPWGGTVETLPVDIEKLGYEKKAEEAWENIIERQTIAGNDIYVNKITGEVFPSAAEAQSAMETKAPISTYKAALEDEFYEEPVQPGGTMPMAKKVAPAGTIPPEFVTGVPELGPIDPGITHPFITGKEEALAQKMAAAESSNDHTVVNDQGYMGKYQFGDARLKDYKDATGVNFKKEDFLNDSKLQDQVFKWHTDDIKNYITKNNLDKAIGTEIMGIPVTIDGLISVAHLGGKSGMKKFVDTGGKYNPSDDPRPGKGTSLSNYLEKFSTAAEPVDSDYLEYMGKTEQEKLQEDLVKEEEEAAAIAAEKERQYAAAQERMNQRDRDRDVGGGYSGDPGGGVAGSPFSRGGRVRYSKGGIVDLL